MSHVSPYLEKYPNPFVLEDQKRVKTAVVTLWIFGVLNLLGGVVVAVAADKLAAGSRLTADLFVWAGVITVVMGFVYVGLAMGISSKQSLGAAKAAFIICCIELGFGVLSFNIITIALNVVKVVLVYRGYKSLQIIVSRVDQPEQENPVTAYYHAFIPLLVHVMMADQVISNEEIKAMEKMCDSVDLSDLERARIFDRAKTDKAPITELVERYMDAAQKMGMQHPVEHLMEAITKMAAADRVFRESERQVIRKIGITAGMDTAAIERKIREATSKMTIEGAAEARELFDLDADFDQATLEAAYRNKMAQSDPAQFAHLGRDVVAKIEQRREALKRAYATLKQ
jgi:uncharacterized tellurite resistance protein B-like protein